MGGLPADVGHHVPGGDQLFSGERGDRHRRVHPLVASGNAALHQIHQARRVALQFRYGIRVRPHEPLPPCRRVAPLHPDLREGERVPAGGRQYGGAARGVPPERTGAGLPPGAFPRRGEQLQLRLHAVRRRRHVRTEVPYAYARRHQVDTRRRGGDPRMGGQPLCRSEFVRVRSELDFLRAQAAGVRNRIPADRSHGRERPQESDRIGRERCRQIVVRQGRSASVHLRQGERQRGLRHRLAVDVCRGHVPGAAGSAGGAVRVSAG